MPLSRARPLDDPAADAALLLTRLGLFVLAFAVPLSAVVSRRAVFTLLPIGGGLLVLAATLLPRPPIERRLARGLTTTAGLGGAALLVWTALSILWTPFPADAGLRWLKEGGTILGVAVVLAVLPERTRTSNLYLFPLGLVPAGVATAVFGLVGAQRLSVFPDPDATLVRAVVSLVVLVWPALGALAVRERWTSAALLVVGITLSAMAAWTPVALTALALGAVAFALATLSPRRAGTVLGVAAAAVLLLAPAIPFVFGPVFDRLGAALGGSVPEFGAMARALHLWADIVASSPARVLTGHGLDLATRGAVVGFLPPEIPRSLAFEIWYDLGLVGAVAAAAVAYGGFVLAGRTSEAVAPFLLAEIVSGLTFALWGLDTTELWWVTTLSVGALAFAVVIRGQYRTERPQARVVPTVEVPDRRRAAS
ncbi:peptide ABC transporter permease [Lichenibacterium dinghuense]|uniref:peptide ABC transporter permease n=1 Tax=Lichenibacterium dinghuense TaxID=2895977 RepID=UPI001F21C2B1|nr:peptide ABC transporter permease [Lichenibacterium sp. 6Y81]